MSLVYQLDLIRQDLRYTLRVLRRSPQLTVAVILTFVLGIGLNSVVFSVFNGLLFRASVSRDPSSFVLIYSTPKGEWRREIHGTLTMSTLEEFRLISEQTRVLSAVTASKWVSFSLGGAALADLRGKFVSCNYLSAHMNPMLLGRAFTDAECAAPGGEPVVVLSARGWRTRFEGDPNIVGRTIRLNNLNVTVIGVAPDDATGDPLVSMIFVPYTLQPVLQGPGDYFRDPPDRHAWLHLSARLLPGRSVGELRSELSGLAKALDRVHPGQGTAFTVTTGAMVDEPGAGADMPIIIGLAMGGATLILLMVCANVTTLLLARAAARRQEMAVRLSLGASRARLIRQLMTESLTLSLAAGALSVGLAYLLPRHVAQMLTDFPIGIAFEPDWRVFSYTFGVTLLAGCIAGLSPAWESLRLTLVGALKQHGQDAAAGSSSFVRGMLIADQLALSLALLVAMGLLLRAQHRLLNPDYGYDPNRVVVTGVDVQRLGYSPSATSLFYSQLLARLEALPGVETVALSDPPPFSGQRQTPFTLEGGDRTIAGAVRSVSPSYFRAVGVPLVRGRLFTEEEARTPGSVMPILVSESFARTYWPGRDGLDQRVRFDRALSGRVVGIVADTFSMRPGQLDTPLLYRPMHPASVTTAASILLRVKGDATPVAQAVRTEMRGLDAQLFAVPETMARLIEREASRFRAVAASIAIPSALAMLLCIVGIYGVTAFATAQRTREMGIRCALGARPHEIFWLLFRGVRWPLLAGLVIGLPLAAFGATLVRRSNLLADVAPMDPWAFGGALIVLTCAAGAATFLPALRAARTDPSRALRND